MLAGPMAVPTAKKSDAAAAEPDDLLSELELAIDRLRSRYEQYFMGIEKVEPQITRREVVRAIGAFQKLDVRSTGARYRFNSLNQKFMTFQTYWNRTMRAIEAGTYAPHVVRAGQRAAREGKEMPDEVMRALPARLRAQIEREREQVAKRAATGSSPAGRAAPAPAAPRPAAPPPVAPEVARLHREFVEARRQLGQDASAITTAQIAATVAKQTQTILTQHGGKSVDFSVAVKDGKVILRATPKK